MGCFGYICPVCNTQIVGNCWDGGELCRLEHYRNGELVAGTVGHYNEYGGVVEDEFYRSNDLPSSDMRSHDAICVSEFGLDSSYDHGSRKILPSGKIVERLNFSDKFSYREGSNELEVLALFLKSKHSVGSRNFCRRLIELAGSAEIDFASDNLADADIESYFKKLDEMRKVTSYRNPEYRRFGVLLMIFA